ncbi:MAG: hypothetical protein ACI4KN_08250 [Gemmiger sp.]
MRAMPLEFPGDLTAEDCDRQYMLGDSILVAPVFRADGSCDYYLPAGRWTHLLTGEEVNGGSWRHDTYDFFSLPVFVRQNTLLPIGACDNTPVYDYGSSLTLRVYSLTDRAERTVFDTHGQKIFTAAAVRKGNTVTVTLDTLPKNLTLLLVNVTKVTDVSGAKAELSPEGILLHAAEQTISYTL